MALHMCHHGAMDLTPYVDDFRHELAVAADACGDDARALAQRLTAPLATAARLTLLNALSDAMGEVTRDLAPGSVVVQLHGLDPEFVVTPPRDDHPRAEREQHRDAPRHAPASVASAPPFIDAGPPGGFIRLQFASVRELESAIALFGRADPDHEALALHLPSDGTVPALRAVLDALDDAAIEATRLTVHSAGLDDVVHSLIGLPHTGSGLPTTGIEFVASNDELARRKPSPRKPRKSPRGGAG
ncbi:hypothetical protein GCM10010349_53320 [Streptomyces flavofungini]|nr:hypothetical protein GCM10010349_53320 [Streptomyces flavofungini]